MQIIRFMTKANKPAFGTGYDGHTATLLEGDIFSDLTDRGQQVTVKKLLPPIQPAAIFCIGLNYRLHARETGMELPRYPVTFMKNPGSVIAHGEAIQIPSSCAKIPEVDYEAELAVVIKTPAKNVSEAHALEHVLGYTCANDVSARRWQKNAGGGQWVKGKSFDTFCPFGPALVTPEEVGDPQNLSVQCILNGKRMQKGHTSDMIFSVAEIISFLSQSATLLPGTLILTGTPAGVGFARKPPVYLTPGDLVETRIESLGSLENRVVAEKTDTSEN
ncbi:MAG: fumarylacetoacetate hydrolase family protein [Desulfobacteraceae bacterium]|nr:fumarylacetoacetate hydrolase family protein [Desulfobacteraceae bacterium]